MVDITDILQIKVRVNGLKRTVNILSTRNSIEKELKRK